ncbi:ubiquitin carboxyl-terminal hydrolase MINDY-1-like [Schistocerca gregaria]|uniref:ubiquitin carboxyl-terminal hydrolase MINDY-1-like n=1 Tax=Schistocerca gregaria TaxID=7010 RepID=UPI00211DDA60|nr:ubiquitin carboxyl-terminal hydrolase MINDY-1-like [Schistocerca gregaria]
MHADSPAVPDGDTFYELKEISFKGAKKRICMQRENGPCPLLAISNALLLRGDICLNTDSSAASSECLLNAIINHMIERCSKVEGSDPVKKNNLVQIEMAMKTVQKLQTGLCVNIQFKDVDSFEFTSESELFDLCGLTLYHGWIPDVDDPDRDLVLSKGSYNALVEAIVTMADSSVEPDESKAEVVQRLRRWLNNNVSQLTFEGIHLLCKKLGVGEIGVFFRNNHFSVITNQNHRLYLLITDQGFQHYKDIVWEDLDTVYGGSNFYDSNFELFVDRTAESSEGQQTARTLVRQQERKRRWHSCVLS